jgi:hypothetical protein
MIRTGTRFIRRAAGAALLIGLLIPGAWAEEPVPPAPPADALQQRIDFGNARILGQQIKSGAVYLMHRKKSDIETMLEVREDYRQEIKDDFNLGNTAITRQTVEAASPPDQ